MAVFIGAALFAAPAQAETITLTGGQVILNLSPRGIMSTNLTGPNFQLSATGDLAFGQTLNEFRICSTAGCGGLDTLAMATFNGLGPTGLVTGGGSFDESTITGSITLHNSDDTRLDTPPFPFTIDFVGVGTLERTETRVTFTVNSPVPEPGTMLLLGSGLTAVVAAVRRRRNTRPPAN
ncbi:MAG TPA: PEP-CTERM sorting domain-containing protein [Pyrinomonadaceae bacterium]|nr:PEP-CTERM sorting domain-containing protein [Pyrinomonadaceae bacterium]